MCKEDNKIKVTPEKVWGRRRVCLSCAHYRGSGIYHYERLDRAGCLAYLKRPVCCA